MAQTTTTVKYKMTQKYTIMAYLQMNEITYKHHTAISVSQTLSETGLKNLITAM